MKLPFLLVLNHHEIPFFWWNPHFKAADIHMSEGAGIPPKAPSVLEALFYNGEVQMGLKMACL